MSHGCGSCEVSTGVRGRWCPWCWWCPWCVRPGRLRHCNVTSRCPGQQQCHIAVPLRRGGAPGARGLRGVRVPRYRPRGGPAWPAARVPGDGSRARERRASQGRPGNHQTRAHASAGTRQSPGPHSTGAAPMEHLPRSRAAHGERRIVPKGEVPRERAATGSSGTRSSSAGRVSRCWGPGRGLPRRDGGRRAAGPARRRRSPRSAARTRPARRCGCGPRPPRPAYQGRGARTGAAWS